MTTLLSAPLTVPATRATGTPAADVPQGVTLYQLTVEQYHDMLRFGVLNNGDPVELLKGLLAQKTAKNPPHVLSATVTADALGRLVPAGYYVARENPFTAAASEPEPDVAVVRGTPRDYATRHPGRREMAIIVEVADSSIQRGRGVKRRVYARAGVPVYWIVLVPERAVEVYADPAGPAADRAYGPPRRTAIGDSIPVVIDGQEVGTVAVADLLP